MKRIVLLTVVTVFGLSAIGGKAAEAVKEGVTPGIQTMDFAAAKALAAEKKLPILLNFSGSDWCGWCKLMEKNVFSKEEWQTFAAANVVTVLLDFPKDKSLVPEKYRERNDDLKEKYGISGYPTFILLDDDGESELGRLGAGRDKTPASFAAEIKGLTRYRESSVTAYVKDLKAEDAAAYRKMIADMAKVEASIKEQKAAIAAANEKIETLTAELEETKTAAVDFRIAHLGAEAQAEYRKIEKERDEAAETLEAWLASEPERSKETMAKFRELSGKVQELEEKLSQY